MNAFAALGLAYLLFTLFSSSVLIAAFRTRLDASARYILFSELCMFLSCGLLIMVNTGAAPVNPFTIWIPNFAILASELAILYGILSTTKKMDKKWFALAIIALAVLTGLGEMYRDASNFRWIILANVTVLTALFISNYWICKNVLEPRFPNNPFASFLKWLALGLIGFGFIRVLANFTSAPIIPRDEPTVLAILAYTLFIILGSFRYMTYIGFRITWVDHSNPSKNALNQPLVEAIEEKNQFLRGLIASNRFIGISALASSLAHQLSQPLTTIAILAETARRDLPSSPQNAHTLASLNEINTQSNQLSDLVQNLRQLFRSKPEKLMSINLQKVCNEVLEIIEPTLQAKSITLIKHYEFNPIIFGDSVQLQQVLINLFNNAIDSIHASNPTVREIVVTISANHGYASLLVRDSGPGIDPNSFPSLFELYKTSKPDGLGVGLWLSKTIMERQRGKIKGFNHAHGGACFEIQIPLSETGNI